MQKNKLETRFLYTLIRTRKAVFWFLTQLGELNPLIFIISAEQFSFCFSIQNNSVVTNN
jgi:hypothetical protein